MNSRLFIEKTVIPTPRNPSYLPTERESQPSTSLLYCRLAPINDLMKSTGAKKVIGAEDFNKEKKIKTFSLQKTPFKSEEITNVHDFIQQYIPKHK